MSSLFVVSRLSPTSAGSIVSVLAAVAAYSLAFYIIISLRTLHSSLFPTNAIVSSFHVQHTCKLPPLTLPGCAVLINASTLLPTSIQARRFFTIAFQTSLVEAYYFWLLFKYMIITGSGFRVIV